MANLSEEEAKLVAEMQDRLAISKRMLFGIANRARKMADINRDAGRLQASNAANRLQGEMLRTVGGVIVAHADSSDSLIDCFDDGGLKVKGPGGGR